MSVASNQLVVPYTQAEKDKLSAVAPGAGVAPDVASQAEALAGVDNAKYMSPLRVAQAIAAAAGSGSGKRIEASFANGTLASLSALSVVSQNADGTLLLTDITNLSIVKNLVGLVEATIAQSASGLVIFQGILENITTSFAINDELFLDNTKSLSNLVPDLGVTGYEAGDAIIRIGQITKNQTNPSNKDLQVRIEVRGVL